MLKFIEKKIKKIPNVHLDSNTYNSQVLEVCDVLSHEADLPPE